MNAKTREQIAEIKELESRIIEFQKDQKEVVIESFRNLLSKIIKIDGAKPTIVEHNVDNPEEFKEGKVTNESKLAFVMKEDRVYSVDLLTKQQCEIEKLEQTYMAKLLPISNKSLLVVGGQTTQKLGKQTQIKNDVTELHWIDLAAQWRQAPKSNMNV